MRVRSTRHKATRTRQAGLPSDSAGYTHREPACTNVAGPFPSTRKARYDRCERALRSAFLVGTSFGRDPSRKLKQHADSLLVSRQCEAECGHYPTTQRCVHHGASRLSHLRQIMPIDGGSTYEEMMQKVRSRDQARAKDGKGSPMQSIPAVPNIAGDAECSRDSSTSE